MIRRKSTLSFSRKHAGHIPSIADALDLPMVPDILDTIDSQSGARFVVLAPTQVFKSLLGQIRSMRSMLVEPSSSGWYAHPEKFVEDFCDEKFNPLFDSMPVLAPLLFDNKNKRAKDKLLLTRGMMTLLSARVITNRQSKTLRDIYFDEPWTYEPGWIEEISKRRSSFDEAQSWREIFMSTGSVDGRKDVGGEFTQVWRSSDQRRWHVRCPSCNRLFHPRFSHEDEKTGERCGGMVYKTIFREDGLPDEGAIAATVVYECPHCRTQLPDTAASRLAMSGTASNPHGMYVMDNPTPSTAPTTIGWQVHGIALKPWAPIALRMVLAHLARQRGDLLPLEKIVRLDFADIWEPQQHFTEKKLRPIGEYSMGDPWDDEAKDEAGRAWRFANIDVQLDHFVLVSRKWAQDSRSRLHHAEKITTAGILADRLASLGVMPERTFLDARHEPQRVRRLCAMYGWRSLMGEGEKDYPHKEMGGLRRIFSEIQPIDPWTGTAQQGRSMIFEFKFSKPSALDRLHLLRTLPTNDGTPLWTCARDCPEWYWKEVDAFRRIRKESEKGVYYEWSVHGPDHAADCESMGVVSASMAGLVGAESLEQPATVPAT